MNRAVSSLLALVLLVSLVTPVIVPASALGSEVEYDTSLVDVWDNHFHDSWGILGGEALGFVSSFFVSECWATMNAAMNKAVFGLAPSLDVLHRRAEIFNSCFESVVAEAFGPILWMGMMPHAEVMWVSNLGAYVICDSVRGIPLITVGGAYAYYRDSESAESVGGGKWIGSKSCDINGKVVVLTADVLGNLCLTLNQAGETCSLTKWGDKYLVIAKDQYFFYCNPEGIPYVFRVDQNYAVDSPNNYYTNNEGDNIYNGGDTVNTTLIDNSSSVVWFPDGTFQYIDQLIYDESTKTYYVDAHSEYNTTNNTFISNTYHYNYHIDYTSITYIGSTAEYDEEYHLYYELPDGRSSADLTAEDLEVLNVSMDVIPYVRSADDTSIRALYHFDGDTLDSSYWSYIGNLEWTQGASITYMEANAFNGALYLDENEHEFTVHLPGNLLSGDFTIQFRYYQSSTMTPVFDSTVHIGDVSRLTMNGAEFVGSSGTLALISVGTWQDVCLMRKSGTLYYFVNGVCYGSVSDSTNYLDTLRFFFGSDQQTYKYLDELRVLNKAAYDPAGYTPSSVPFDTNLALVLPDTAVPVADEYWKFDSEGNLFSNYSWIGDSMTELPISGSSTASWISAFNSSNWWYSSGTSYAHHITVDYLPECVRVNNSAASVDPNRRIDRIDGSGVYFVVASSFDSWVVNKSLPIDDLSSWSSLTFSVLLLDGTLHSVTTSSLYDLRYSAPATTILPNGGMIQIGCSYDLYNHDDGSYGYYLAIIPPAQGSMDIVYVELKEGETANTGHEFVNAVAAIDRADLDKATLAVRTDLEITGHQIGGVRPSLPTKGLVWALVEAGRMTSLQIYNGQAWEEVDGRIWTGSRWIPYYAFDVLLLKDMYDVVESDPTKNPIYTESGFWKWLQDAWAVMLDKLDQIIAGLSGVQGNCKHEYEMSVDREVGCVVRGTQTYTCKLCGHAYTEVVDAIGHDWVITESVINTVNGASVTLNDSAKQSLRGLTLYGKTVQNGTPSPDNPVPLESVGADGTVGVTVAGKNLFCDDMLAYEKQDVYQHLKLKPNTKYTMSTNFTGDEVNHAAVVFFLSGRVDTGASSAVNGVFANKPITQTTDESGYVTVYTRWPSTSGLHWWQLEEGTTATAYEPYKAQTLTAQTPNGLLGIKLGATIPDLIANSPAHMSGVYWDEKTQAYWLCDTIDGASGKHVQRVFRWDLSEAEFWSHPESWKNASAFTTSVPKKHVYGGFEATANMLCNRLVVSSPSKIANGAIASVGLGFEGISVYVSITGADSSDGLKSYLDANPTEIIYPLATPIETDLSAEELAQYAALRTNSGNTTVFNDSGAGMVVSYVPDGQQCDVLSCTVCGAVSKDYGRGPEGIVTPDEEEDSWSLVDLLVVVKDGVWSFATGVVGTAFGGLIGFASGVGDVGDFFDAYKPDRGNDIFGILEYEGADIWD